MCAFLCTYSYKLIKYGWGDTYMISLPVVGSKYGNKIGRGKRETFYNV